MIYNIYTQTVNPDCLLNDLVFLWALLQNNGF